MKNNQGMTLVELIIVMVIMGILAGGAFLGVQSLDSGKVQSSVKRINALLDYVRVQDMSKKEAYYLILEEVSGSYYVKVQTRDESGGSVVSKDILTEKLKLKNGVIRYDTNASATPITIDADVTPAVTLQISFIKESGALEADSGGAYVNKIEVSAAGRSYTINLVAMTGKHYIE